MKLKYIEIKLKYPDARIKALRSSLAKKGTTLEDEMMESLQQIYRKHVKSDVREFIEEMEDDDQTSAKKSKSSRNNSITENMD